MIRRLLARLRAAIRAEHKFLFGIYMPKGGKGDLP
jgi:hypothetical protein